MGANSTEGLLRRPMRDYFVNCYEHRVINMFMIADQPVACPLVACVLIHELIADDIIPASITDQRCDSVNVLVRHNLCVSFIFF